MARAHHPVSSMSGESTRANTQNCTLVPQMSTDHHATRSPRSRHAAQPKPVSAKHRPEQRRRARGPFIVTEGAQTQRAVTQYKQRRLVVVRIAGKPRFPPVPAGPGHRLTHDGIAALVRFVESTRPEAKQQ